MVTMEDVDDFGGKFGLLPQVGLIFAGQKPGKNRGICYPLVNFHILLWKITSYKWENPL